MTSSGELTPETLERYFGSGIVTTHHVNDSPDIILRIDSPGQKISILTPHDGTALDTSALRRVTTDIDIRNGVEWARLTLDARGMHAEAYGLLVSVVQAIRGGATFAAASSVAMTNMRTLLAARPRISEQRQIGLVGELLLLRALLDRFDEATVVDWWLGPLAEERDFAFPAFDAEVKTTLSETRTHVINGVGQLEPSPGRSLWLVSIQLTRAGGDPNGVGLPDLIFGIRERLMVSRDRFISRLARDGWEDGDRAVYPNTYVLRTTPVAYLVDEDFPALTSARLRAVVPHSELVSHVTYRVDVSRRNSGWPGEPLDSFITHPAQEE